MKRIVLILLVFVSVKTSAQVTGYLGKRFSLTYSFWGHPSIPAVNDAFSTSNPNPDFNINCSQALEVNYVVGKRSAVCLTYHFAHLGVGYSDLSSYDGNFRYNGTKPFPAYLNENGLAIGYKLFSRARFAPLGAYIKFEFVGVFNKIKYTNEGVSQKYIYSNGTQEFKPATFEPGAVTSFGGGVCFSIGRQRIYKDKIIIDRGVRFGMVIAPSDNYPSGSGYAYANQFLSAGRVFFNQLVNFRIGIGFLAF